MQGDPQKDRDATAEDDAKAMADEDRAHRFADDEQVEEGAAGAPEARTDGMGG
jgi:hypothetical protein